MFNKLKMNEARAIKTQWIVDKAKAGGEMHQITQNLSCIISIYFNLKTIKFH